jgi:hypothetical protein
VPTIASSLLLIALVSFAPFAWFYSQNLHEPILLRDIAVHALAVLAAAWLVFAVLFIAVRPRSPRLAVALAAFIFLFFNYLALSQTLDGLTLPNLNWEPGSDSGPLAGWAILAGTLWCFAIWLGRWPAAHHFALLFAAANLAYPLVVTGLQELPEPGPELPLAEAYPLAGNDVWSGQATSRPNVYWIVTDSYPNRRELLDYYGFDNSAFLAWLSENGFYVAEDSYANFNTTLLSVPTTLNMDYVFGEQDLEYEVPLAAVGPRGGVSAWARLNGNTNGGVNAAVAGDNRSVAFFQQLGYRYIHFEGRSFLVTRCRGYEDICIEGELAGPSELQYRLLSLTPLRDLVESSPALRRILQPRRRSASGTGLPELSRGLAEALRAGPLLQDPFFLYAHISSPHRPYLNDPQCNLLESHVDRRGNRHFLNQLQCVNRHLKEFLSPILTSDPGALIVLSSDHGPRLSVQRNAPLRSLNQMQIRENLGILNSFRLPENCQSGLRQDLTPVNTMRIVFACLGGHEPSLLAPLHFVVRPGSPQRGKIRQVSLRRAD